MPSPCGPNSQCRLIGTQAACSCLPNYLGRAPNCRPECTIDAECSSNLACRNEKCEDPCTGSCGQNAVCKVVKHNAVCICSEGYEGDPFTLCKISAPICKILLNLSELGINNLLIVATEIVPIATPCTPSPCGPNSECRERNGAGACYCHVGYEGNPYDSAKGCRRECESNLDCSNKLSCVRFKCVDPCVGTCGIMAECNVENHVPDCKCPYGYNGDPFYQCKPVPLTRKNTFMFCIDFTKYVLIF